ncbi:hypothetical protein U1Q18_005828 [Sarracenia purpurea var. burkii]
MTGSCFDESGTDWNQGEKEHFGYRRGKQGRRAPYPVDTVESPPPRPRTTFYQNCGKRGSAVGPDPPSVPLHHRRFRSRQPSPRSLERPRHSNNTDRRKGFREGFPERCLIAALSGFSPSASPVWTEGDLERSPRCRRTLPQRRVGCRR